MLKDDIDVEYSTSCKCNCKCEEVLEKLDEVLEGQQRLEEAIANISTPGANYSVDYVDVEE